MPKALILRAMKHILIAEDDEDIRNFLQMVVESFNFKVTTSPDGNDAWEKINSLKIDLLITDYRMPQMDGALLSRLTHEKFPEIPILLISTFNPKDPGILDIVHTYLPKPFEAEVLKEKLDAILGGVVVH